MSSQTAWPSTSPSDHPADVQKLIYSLAQSIGVTAADLSSAIRPLTDPTVPNPVEEIKRLREQLTLVEVTCGSAGAGVAGTGAGDAGDSKVKELELEAEKEEEKHAQGLGLLGFVEEAFMD